MLQATDVKCPTCGAGERQPCVRLELGDGKANTPYPHGQCHASRIEVANKATRQGYRLRPYGGRRRS